MMRRTSLALAIAALLAPLVTHAADDARKLDAVIVTGTRVTDRTLTESQSPIDIITTETLQSTGTVELATALARVLPSLNFPRPAITDGTSGVRPAQLRGLAPDQVLVLVNGKRRHIAAQVNVNGSIGRGSSAVDLNAIPISAIARVEVLRDGASAQYGSDAIAGVVNIVLKGSESGGSLTLDAGQHSVGDGRSVQLAADAGLSYGEGIGRLHLSGQITDQDHTNRARPYRPDPAQGVAPNPHNGNNPGVGEKGFIYGDPAVEARNIAFNTEVDVSDTTAAYAHGIFGERDIVSFAFYRSRNHSGQGALLAQVYPNGFVPEINQISKDHAFVAGLRGGAEDGWSWDLSYNYGNNDLAFYTQNSINYSLGAGSPTRFYDGTLEYTQHVFNLDLARALDIGLAYPATLSVGAEYRSEKWGQSAGAPTSYTGSGAQGFAGFTPANAGDFDRNSVAIYGGLEADFSERFSGGLALRHEDFDDFGSELSGKLSGRFAVNEAVALRGTIASGFRAPALGQQYYQAITSNIISGVFYESGTFRTTSPAALALGAESLKAETSLSYSLGLVLQPLDRLYLTIDAYSIDIDDRIALSSNLIANDAVTVLLASLGITNVTSARYFTNAVDTRTKGVDVVGSYSIPLDNSTLNLTAGYNYNKTDITRIAPNPAQLTALGAELERIGRDERARFEEGYPRDKATLGASWNFERWDIALTATRYGEFTVRQASAAAAARDQSFGAKWLLDASVSFRPADRWTVTLGADNILDAYPDENIYLNSTTGQFPYSSQSPFGFNGAYAYGRISYAW
ncbi:TonB-dependent receptor [Xanthomonadaceae bacterium JHOS43]|nr:TonB-dependent receptor [Xanthomonadaceae bacterium JHOS43]MCX7563003.1 TonB-dependent receptor [Xanthomonadaceae bacterium XH05]